MIYLGNTQVGISTAGMVGGLTKFTKYEKKVMTFPDAQNQNAWSCGAIVPVSFKPLLAIFYGGTDENYNIIEGVVVYHETDSYSSGGFGVMNARNGSNGNIVRSGINVMRDDATHGSGLAGICQYYDDKLWITRGSANYYWSNTDSYTFEIYG